MSIKCPKCGSKRLTYTDEPNPFNVNGGFSITYTCQNCLHKGLYRDIASLPSVQTVPYVSSVPKGKVWHVHKSTVGRVEIIATIPFAIHSAIVDALDHAKTKHPHFADTDAEAGTVIAEELLEVNTAALKVMQGINDQADRDNLFEELAQLNATTIRMMEKLLK